MQDQELTTPEKTKKACIACSPQYVVTAVAAEPPGVTAEGVPPTVELGSSQAEMGGGYPEKNNAGQVVSTKGSTKKSAVVVDARRALSR